MNFFRVCMRDVSNLPRPSSGLVSALTHLSVTSGLICLLPELRRKDDAGEVPHEDSRVRIGSCHTTGTTTSEAPLGDPNDPCGLPFPQRPVIILPTITATHTQETNLQIHAIWKERVNSEPFTFATFSATMLLHCCVDRWASWS